MDRMPSMGPNTHTPELVDSTHPGLKPTWLHQTKKLPLKIAVHSQVTMETMVVGMKVVIMVTTMTNARLNATVTTMTNSVGMLATSARMTLTAMMKKGTTMEVKVTTTTRKTMMVLMMVLNKVALLVKSLALTANANVNMKTWSAG